MIPNYDRVAFIYDRLASLVFGNHLKRAKTVHLEHIDSGDRLLIVGGGSGQILAYLDEVGLACQVDFVDVSQSMLNRARAYTPLHITATFFKRDILLHTSEKKYDVIITNFFFDQYNEAPCRHYIQHLRTLLKAGGLLLYADFIPPQNLWDKLIKHFMYNFFRLTIGLGKVQLIDHRSIFLKEGFEPVQTTAVSSFIVAEVLRMVE